jgi:FixJ family two-component response regulator
MVHQSDMALGEVVFPALAARRRNPPPNRASASGEDPTVFVVDPDPATGIAVKELLRGTNLRCEVWGTGREFFAAYQDDLRPGCVVLEQRIPDMSGLQIQRRLSARGSVLPLVFVSANSDVSTAVALMRGGAVHVLEKPPRSIELLNAIQEAISLNEIRRGELQEKEKVRVRLAALTRKERHVLQLIGQGRSIKGIAATLGLCVRAVELRRRSLMEKLAVQSSLELMRFSVATAEDTAEQHLVPGVSRSAPVEMELV